MIVKGNKVDLVTLKIHDIKNKNYVSWLNNKKLLKYSNQRFENNTINNLKKFYLSLKKNNDFFCKIVTKNKIFIGTIICRINHNHKTGNLGILIGNKKFKSKDMGYDAWITAIQYLKKSKKLRKIYAGTLTCNKPMLKIFKKSKMKFEARLKKQEIYRNKYYDTLIYSKF